MNVGPKQIGTEYIQKGCQMQVSWRGFIHIFAGESGKGAELYNWLLLMPDFLL